MSEKTGSTQKWKTEVVAEHKFSYVNLDDYKYTDTWSLLSYMGVFVSTLQYAALYILDITTAVMLLWFDTWGTTQKELQELSNQTTVFQGPVFTFMTQYGWTIYLASIVVSLMLVMFDISKTAAIVRSSDISLACTSSMAKRLYSLRSYAYWCFFQNIKKQLTRRDLLIGFVYFQLRTWKRLLFAEAPRQIVNFFLLVYLLFTMYASAQKKSVSGTDESVDLSGFRLVEFLNYSLDNPDTAQSVRFFIMLFVFTAFVAKVIFILVALGMYVPLAMHVRGNLKEYYTHKIDKRIGELLYTNAQARIKIQRQQLQSVQPYMYNEFVSPAAIPNVWEPDHAASLTSAYGALPVVPQHPNASNEFKMVSGTTSSFAATPYIAHVTGTTIISPPAAVEQTPIRQIQHHGVSANQRHVVSRTPLSETTNRHLQPTTHPRAMPPTG